MANQAETLGMAEYNEGEVQRVPFEGEAPDRIRGLVGVGLESTSGEAMAEEGADTSGKSFEEISTAENEGDEKEVGEIPVTGTPRLYDEKGRYILKYHPEHPDAKAAYEELKGKWECDLSGLNPDVCDAMTPAECAKKIIELGKPNPKEKLIGKDNKEINRSPETSVTITQGKDEKKPPTKVNIFGSKIEIVGDRNFTANGEIGVKVCIFGETFDQMDSKVEEIGLKPGENIIKRSEGRDLVLYVRMHDENQAVIDVSQGKLDLRALNNELSPAA